MTHALVTECQELLNLAVSSLVLHPDRNSRYLTLEILSQRLREGTYFDERASGSDRREHLLLVANGEADKRLHSFLLEHLQPFLHGNALVAATPEMRFDNAPRQITIGDVKTQLLLCALRYGDTLTAALMFAKALESEEVRFREMVLFGGMNIDADIAISDGLRLTYPSNDMLDTLTEIGNDRQIWLDTVTGDSAVAVCDWVVRPRLLTAPEWTSDYRNTDLTDRFHWAPSIVGASRWDVHKFALALSMACRNTIMPVMSWIEMDDDELINVPKLGGCDMTNTHMPLTAMTADEEMILDGWHLYQAFLELDDSDWERLLIPVERVASSWLPTKSKVDRFIDLGIALETIYGGREERGEITNRIATRAAWHLGGDSSERQDIFRQVADIYRLRSTAVHTGQLKLRVRLGASNIPLEAAVDISLGFCDEAIRKVTEEGWYEAGDWRKLTLGGGRKRRP